MRSSGRPGPRPAPPPSRGSGDSRQGVRVEHLLRMDYQVVAREEVEGTRRAVQHSPRILKAEWPPAAPLPAVAAGAEETSLARWAWDTPPELARSLERIERKLDLLLERLGVDAPGLKPKPLYNVILSARGLRFRDHRRQCQTGDMVYVCLELPLEPTVEIMALAETTCVVEDSGSRGLSAGRDVVLEFRAIQAEARALIERYCRTHQAGG